MPPGGPKDDKNKYNHSLIGPASQVVNLRDFLRDVQVNWSLCTGTDEGLIYEPFAHLSKQQREEIEARCSVDDLKQENQQHFLDDGFLADLKLWQWARAYCGSDDPDRINKALSEAGTAAKSRKVGANANGEAAPAARGRKKKATSAEAESPANEEILIDPALDGGEADSPEPSTSATPNVTTKGRAKVQRKKREPQAVPEPALAASIDSVKTALMDSDLRTNHPIYGYHYLRRTRQSDYQSLSHLRTTYIPVFSEYATTDEALDHYKTTSLATELLVYVSVHPIPNRVTAGKAIKDAVTIPARLQKIVFLASQTLADLRDAIVSVPNALPDLRNEADDLQDVLRDPAEGPSSVGNVKRPYVDRKWKTGAVVAIDGKLYPDVRNGQQNYADLLLQLINSEHNWPAREDGDVTYPQMDTSDILLGNDTFQIDPSLVPQASTFTAPTAPGPSLADRDLPVAPVYAQAGKAMHETTFMDLLHGIRLGTPNLLWQQGADERVFVFEDIRLLHHTDPAPVLPRIEPEVSPYPITTFLSRLNVSKCNVCERDPATKVTVEDELSGMTPCPICDVCLNYLHGSEEQALQNGVQIVPILEDLD